jgi:hypothetical protein
MMIFRGYAHIARTAISRKAQTIAKMNERNFARDAKKKYMAYDYFNVTHCAVAIEAQPPALAALKGD